MEHSKNCQCQDCSDGLKQKEGLEILKESHGNSLTLFLRGMLNTQTAVTNEKIILNSINETSELTLDMNGVNFLSSAGIRLLIMLAKKAKSENKIFQLACLQPVVYKTLEMSGMLGILKVT